MFPKAVYAACAVLALCSLAACKEGARASHAGAPVLKVNGTVITQPEVDRTVKGMLARQHATHPLTPEQMKEVSGRALDQLASAELLYGAAAKTEVKDLDKSVEERYAKNRAAFPTEAAYQKALQSMSMTPDEVKEALRKEIVINAFIATEIAPKVTVSEDDAKRFYEANREKLFKTGERLRVSHILVGVDEKATPAQKQAAREKAEALLKRVQNGEDFAEVARKESSCPSKARGGELGIFPKGGLMPQFEKAAFALKPGGVSQVVETVYGYHIIKLHEKLPAGYAAFEEAHDKIVQYLKREGVRKAVTALVEELRKKARIEKA